MNIPAIIIAGTHSGCGKTTVASGIMAALTARGMIVQPFKIGPDFIDPSHHTRICGRPSRNLDPFMMGKTGVISTFHRACAGADIAVIEGVMGIFDGIDGSDYASTAHVARILQVPVILVVDIKGMSRSVHALIKGYREFDPAIRIAGVLFNRAGSTRHRNMIESSLAVRAFGWIPQQDDLAVKSRHLGLAMAHESGIMAEFGKILEESCDLDGITAAALNAPATSGSLPAVRKFPHPRVTIGIGLDEAFCFYYQDNLDSLRRAGADLVFFSPLRERLPDVDAVYLGGGYPELHLPVLESSACTPGLKKAADSGMPVYAECGGLLYLTREIVTDQPYHLCGILPATAGMTSRIAALGYVKGRSTGNSAVVPAGLTVRGQEFHYSEVYPEYDARYAFRLSRGKGIAWGQDGIYAHNAIGAYAHVYFPRNFVGCFVSAAERFSGS